MKQQLQASTLIEVIVASVLFLTILTIALHTVTSIATNRNQDYSIPQVDSRVKECLARYSSGEYTYGEFREQYPFGEILIVISKYEGYDSLKVIKIDAKMYGCNMLMSCKFLIDR